MFYKFYWKIAEIFANRTYAQIFRPPELTQAKLVSSEDRTYLLVIPLSLPIP